MILDKDELGRADAPRNRLDQHPTPRGPPVLVHPPGPTATCKTCRQVVKVMLSSGLAFWHRAPGSNAGCEDLYAYGSDVLAWKAEVARHQAV